MASDMTKIEAYNKMIKALQEYCETIDILMKKMKTAAEVCKVANGNDSVVQKNIVRLQQSIDAYNNSKRVAMAVMEQMKKEKKDLLDIMSI